MNTRDYHTKIHTHLQNHNTYKLLTHNPTNTIAYDAHILIHYIHSENLSSMGYQKCKNQTSLSALLFQDVMVELTISHTILPT